MRVIEKDWTGNSNSVFRNIGASNHSDSERQTYDYYATNPKAAELLLGIEDIPEDKPIWECACGERHLSKVFERHGYKVRSSDLVVRTEGVEQLDFLGLGNTEPWDGTIVTNPPYKFTEDFIRKALSLVTDGSKVCMFLKLQHLEGKSRRELYDTCPPIRVWVSSGRIGCAMNGDFEAHKMKAIAFAWFVWVKGFKGETTLKWFN